jgi:hypothetical protein
MEFQGTKDPGHRPGGGTLRKPRKQEESCGNAVAIETSWLLGFLRGALFC